MGQEDDYTLDLFITDPTSIRTFSRMIHCASKIGDQIMFVPQPPSTLTLRVINPSLSTFGHFRCHQSFFATTKLTRSSPSAKLLSRSLQPLFRASQSISTLRIAATPDPVYVLFELKSRTSVIKRFRVPVITGRLGLTAFDKRTATCMLQARPRLFLDVLTHFHMRLDEITFAPAPSNMRVASYIDDMSNPANVMLRTEMTIDTREFDVYTFSKTRPVSLTIFCKYLRSVLDFCDPFDSPVSMWYEAAGLPVLFELIGEGASAEPAFDAQFIFASRHAEDETSQPLSAQATPRSTVPSHARPGSGSNQRTHTPLQVGVQPGIPSSNMTSPGTGRRLTPAETLQHSYRNESAVHKSANRESHVGRNLEVESSGGRAVSPSTGNRQSGQVNLPLPQRSPNAELRESSNGAHDDDMEDEDDEYVEGTPPP